MMIEHEILNHIEAGVLLLDNDFTIIYINPWLVNALPTRHDVNVGVDKFQDIFLGGAQNARVNQAINLALEKKLSSVISPILNKFPLKLISGKKMKKEQMIPYIRVIPFKSKAENLCMVQIADVTTFMRRDASFSLQSKRLNKLVQFDDLTGIYNRRYFDMFLKNSMANIGSGISSVALIFIDVDFFKNFNDLYGHQAGDQCLLNIANKLKSSVRQGVDCVARYGGEEFCIILNNISYKKACIIAEKVRFNIENLSIPHEESPHQVVTVSMGLAVVDSKNKESMSSLILKSDSSLYRAKQSGRNCIHSINMTTP